MIITLSTNSQKSSYMERFAQNMKRIEDMEKGIQPTENTYQHTTHTENEHKPTKNKPRQKRNIETVHEITNTVKYDTLDISDLPGNWKVENLMTIFSKYGAVKSIQKNDKETTA